MIKLSDAAQEILENLWVNGGEKKTPVNVSVLRGEPVLEELISGGYLKISDEKTYLTDKGIKEGRACVRRHRLAERLLADVFSLRKGAIHEAGCKFEHALHEELEENICTLLGHPSECPHGSPIPPGKCCEEFKTHPEPIVKSLADFKKDEAGTIAYIYTKEKHELQKIMALGALPSNHIKLIQRFPSYVFQIGHSQFAVDKPLAKKIFVRPKKAQSA